jgi:DNA-binding response OmpR family regulator
MAIHSTLLCIHRDPAQLSSLQEKGYELVTAINGHDGLRLFMSQHVDAIVLEYHLGLLDGSVVATEIKKVRPHLPIVMLADHLELPDAALKSIDALVTKADSDRFLLETIHFVLSVKPAQQIEKMLGAQTRLHVHRPRKPREEAGRMEDRPYLSAVGDRDAPFSRRVWRSIWNGSIQF